LFLAGGRRLALITLCGSLQLAFDIDHQSLISPESAKPALKKTVIAREKQ
jgi:preprotein translocase subunit SecD